MPTIKTFIRFYIMSAMFVAPDTVQGQTGDSLGVIQIKFLKEEIQIDGNAFQFNSLAISNTSDTRESVTIQLNLPGTINLISALPKEELVIEAGKTYFLPLRFNTKIDSQYAFTQQISAIVTSSKEIAKAGFMVKVMPFYNWRSTLQQSDIPVADNNSRYNLSIYLENLGNVPDEFTIDYESDKGVALAKKPEKIMLKAGESRFIEMEAIVRLADSDLYTNLNFYIRGKTGDKKMLLQKFTRLASKFDQKSYSRARVPLTVELMAENIGSGQAYYSLGLNGVVSLPKDRELTIQFISDSYYKGGRSKSALGHLSYRTKNNTFNIGNIQDFKQFFVVGNGMEFIHSPSSKRLYRVSAISGRTDKARLYNFSTEQTVAKNLFLLSENYVHIAKNTGANSYLSISSLRWQVNRSFGAMISTGGGFETIDNSKYNFDTVLSGGMIGYDVEMKRKTWSARSKINSYSKNIPGFNKGFNNHMHEIRKPLGNHSLAAFFDVNKKIFNQTYDSIIKLAFNVSNKETGLRGSYAGTALSVNAAVSMFYQQQDSANSPIARMFKTTANLSWMLTPSLTLSLYSNIGRVNIPDKTDFKPYFAITTFGSVQLKGMGIQFRYDRRPFYYFEIKQFGHVPDSFRYLQVSPFYEKAFAKISTVARFTVNYSDDKALGHKFMLFGNQITHTMHNAGIDLTMFAQYNTVEKKNSYVNFRVRKKLLAPAYKVRESVDFDIVLFQDINGNDLLDDGDRLITGAEVMVNSMLVNSDKSGVIQFRNIGDKSFEVDFSKIRNLKGWMPKAGYKQTIMVMAKEKKILIPFRESRGIRGSIKLIADEKSNRRMSLSNIRITATDQKGLVYHTLTDNNNEFYFDLPAGIYLVMLNHGVFDEEFRPAEISKQVDLINNNILEVQFEVRQRKRQINIKHDDDDDEEED